MFSKSKKVKVIREQEVQQPLKERSPKTPKISIFINNHNMAFQEQKNQQTQTQAQEQEAKNEVTKGCFERLCG